MFTNSNLWYNFRSGKKFGNDLWRALCSLIQYYSAHCEIKIFQRADVFLTSWTHWNYSCSLLLYRVSKSSILSFANWSRYARANAIHHFRDIYNGDTCRICIHIVIIIKTLIWLRRIDISVDFQLSWLRNKSHNKNYNCSFRDIRFSRRSCNISNGNFTCKCVCVRARAIPK